MIWTLEYDGETQSLAAWGADASGTLSLQNQTEGVLMLHFPGMMDADVPFAYKGKVILRLDEEIVFRGHAMEPQRSDTGEQGGITMTFVDAWWFLTQGTLTQTIYDGGLSAATRAGTLTSGSADVTLADVTGLAAGMTVAGTGIPTGAKILSVGMSSMTLSDEATVSGSQTLRFTTGVESNLYALFARLGLGEYARQPISDTLRDIITACDVHHGGGVIQYGACYGDAFDLVPQPVDVQGTFATAVQAALGWAPDAVPFVDPTTDPPTVSFYQRGAAPVKTVAFADKRMLISQEIQERRDLLITGVRILYRRYLMDGTPATQTDAAGATFGPGVVQVEMQLYAATSPPRYVPPVAEKQYLKVLATLEEDTAWWFKHAALGVKSADDIIIEEDTPQVGLDPDAPENEDAEDLDDVSGCTNRIIEGSIPAWLSDSAHLRYIRVGAYLILRIWNDPDADDYEDKGYKVVRRRIILKFAATDLGTNMYENTVTTERWEGGTYDPEAPPTGIAAAILAAQGVLQYQGALTLTDDDCDVSFAPGQVLNVSGSEQAAWGGMKAQIQSVTHQLYTGTTAISFGPAENLAPQDYLEITRRTTRLKPALDLTTRAGIAPEEDAGSSSTVHHPSTQIRFGITQTDNVTSKKDVDGDGSVESVTVSGKHIWSNGTTTITVDCSGNVFSIIGADGRKIILDLDMLPAGAVMQPRSMSFCDSGGEKTAMVMMTEPA